MNLVTLLNWSDFLQVLRCRAVEDADTTCRLWSPDVRRQATSDAINAAKGQSTEMLRLRSLALMSRPETSDKLSLPQLPVWFKPTPIILVLAFVAGWSLVGVGQEREINLLALPLVGLLLWNVTVITLSLFSGLHSGQSRQAPSWLAALMKRDSSPTSNPTDAVLAEASLKFREAAMPPSLSRVANLSKALLHGGAAVLALGSITAMYAHGWSNEYRAVWESTLLGEQGVATFFRWIFAPASFVSGLQVPLGDLPAMHRTITSPAPHPAEALPWIHLYALTLFLGIVIPRVLFAALETWRSSKAALRVLASPEWSRYIGQLRNDAAPRGDGAATLLIHASGLDDAAISRWQSALLSCWREVGHIKVTKITSGDEDEFPIQWRPESSWLAFAFSLATTPEDEVHGGLIKQTVAKLRESRPDAKAMLLLDATPFESRWKGMADLESRLNDKTALWRRVTAETPMDIRLLRANGVTTV